MAGADVLQDQSPEPLLPHGLPIRRRQNYAWSRSLTQTVSDSILDRIEEKSVGILERKNR